MSNYIEEKLKEFNNWYDDLDDGLYQADKSEIRDFIKQALQEQEERIRGEMKEKLLQIVIEDVPHQYQERLLKELNI